MIKLNNFNDMHRLSTRFGTNWLYYTVSGSALPAADLRSVYRIPRVRSGRLENQLMRQGINFMKNYSRGWAPTLR